MKHTQDETPKTLKGVENWNYAIARYFLNNNRLTILALLFLVIIGLVATFSLKTTGFPNPEIKTVLVRTIYPGASAETVNREITIPLENAIKPVSGIETYRSTSANSVSIISVSIKDDADSNSVKSELNNAISSPELPEKSEKPSLVNLNIGGPDYVLSIIHPNNETQYNVFKEIESQVLELPQTASITPNQNLKKELVVKVDNEKLKEKRIQVSDIENAIKPLGESIPVVSNQTIDGKSVTITTSINDKSIETIQNLVISPQSQPSSPSTGPSGNPFAPNQQSTPTATEPVKVPLNQIATIQTEYRYEQEAEIVGFTLDGKGVSSKAFVFEIKTQTNTDQAAFNSKLEEIIKEVKNSVYSKDGVFKDTGSNAMILENYTVNDSNQEQVNEVISGLIGGKLAVDNPFVSNLGWLVGGIQLVFLVMLAFVSWRAAIVSATAIPLSLVFSNIYLYFTGQNLNTLVLFSLVLVIGLVVDPALVVLESIQRKIDIGLKGKHAALEAIKDVGDGLFLATLTNIIVFAPFGIISGVLGQIFKYIPLTIVPAVIGSYIVPLVFLAWVGGIFLKKTKNKTDREEDNLWGVAKALVNLNQKILYGSRWLRLLIIVATLGSSIAISAYFISTRQIKVTQFSSSDNGKFLVVNGTFLPSTSKETKTQIRTAIVEAVQKNEFVVQTFPFGQGDISYYVVLESAQERKENISSKIAKSLDEEIQKFAKEFTSEISVGVDSNGPPASSFQVQLSVKEQNPDTLKSASIEIGKKISKICFDGSKATVTDNCEDKNRIVAQIDDGYTTKTGSIIDIELNRAKLKEKGLSVGGLDSILVNQSIKSQFETGDGEALTTIQSGGEDIDVILDKQQEDTKTKDALSGSTLTNILGQNVPLSDVATLNQKDAKSAISRVKGQAINVVSAKLKEGFTDQNVSAAVTQAIVDFYSKDNGEEAKKLNLKKSSVESFSEGGSAGFLKSFNELGIALVIAIILTYIVLAIFFNSLLQPIVILYTIPVTLIGIMPGLSWFAGGQFGFLEIIGMIILIGIVENAAIFLVDSARQRIHDGEQPKKAIAISSGLRFRPVLLTNFTAIASLAPLAFLSELYRSISIVIMFGLFASGFISLVTTPILFIFFRWVSEQFTALKWYNKLLFFPLFPIYIIALGIKDKND